MVGLVIDERSNERPRYHQAAKAKTEKKGGSMFKFFSYKKLIATIGKAFIVICFLSVLVQAPDLKAQSLIEKARKEGTITFYSGLTIPDTQIVAEAFMKKYPFIEFDYIRLNSTKRLQRLIMEKLGGVRKGDVAQAHVGWVQILRDKGITQKHVSPETKDWPKGFKDPQGYWATYYTTYHSFAYNTRMVSEKEAPKRYEDLLDPKWKGKIGMSSNEYEWYKGMLDLMGREKGLQFMKRYADQDLIINQGRTLSMQLMISGEFPIAKAAIHRALQMKKKGAPIQWTTFPTPTLVAMRALVLLDTAPHPNAGKLFINWMMSKDGQKVLNSIDRHPVRKDIKVDPVLEKIRANLFPIKPASGEETTAYMKEFNRIVLKR